jgi:2-methylisocitrate lyase-like PEP mutase family enzyme
MACLEGADSLDQPHIWGIGVSRLTVAEPGSTIQLGDVKLVVQQDQEKNMTVNAKARVLREKLAKGEFILAPGIYDGISARVADRMGFPALYMTGYGATASMLGLPDAGLATYSDMVGRAEMICSVIDTPLIADADTGYGGLLNVQRTVRGYEAAGVAAIQIEDQEMPKKCGHTPGRRVVPVEDMVLKIKVAVEARRDPATLIVARTDARTAHGLDEALRRAKAYETAGADIIFVESPESEAELEKIGKEVEKPLLANMVEFGKTPRVEVDRLKKWGFDVAIYPGLGFSVAAEAMRQSWEFLKEKGTSNGIALPQYRNMHELMGFSEVWDFEKKWAS